MTDRAPPALHVAAVLLAMICALFLRAWLQIRLRANGYDVAFASDLSWLVVPPALLILLWPVLWRDRRFLAQLLDMRYLELRIVFEAVITGALMRLAWWGQLVAIGSFGLYGASGESHGSRFLFDCPAPAVLATGFVAMAISVPLVEEISFRGYALSALRRRGKVTSIIVSAAVFAAFHSAHGYPVAFVAGVVLGTQYLRHGTLWPSIVTHLTFNAIALIDWRCLRGYWRPDPSVMPLIGPGIAATLLTVTAIGIVFVLIRRIEGRGNMSPRPSID